MKYSIWIIQPRGWLHMRMFVDIATAMADALERLGHEVAFAPGDGPALLGPSPFPDGSFGRSIIFGAHFLPDVPLPPDAILFNTEQVPPNCGGDAAAGSELSTEWLRGDFLKLARRHEVWDYSKTNAERLRRLGVPRVKHCPIGFSPTMRRTPPLDGNVEDGPDVLFYGTLTERRMRLFNELTASSVRVAGRVRKLELGVLQGVYGADLDKHVARSKVVLCAHALDPASGPAIFEMVRCSYLFANRKCVVAEGGGQDADMEAFANKACVVVPFADIVRACTKLVENREDREAVADRGLRAFSGAASFALSVSNALHEEASA